MTQKTIIAVGIEIRDDLSILTDFLNDNADAGKAMTWTYPKKATGAAIKHEVSIVFTMAELSTAIETSDVYVIYDGHSRFGQGPAFGDDHVGEVPDVAKYPVNPWGVHYRMGYDATDSEAMGDLLRHSVMPTEYDLTTIPSSAFLPKTLITAGKNVAAVQALKAAKKLSAAQTKAPCSIAGSWRDFNTCFPKVAATTTARKETPLKGRHYYVYKPGKKRSGDEYLVSATVGSTDIDKSALKCKLLFMASCSSKVHFLEALDRRRKAVKSACKFYLTENVCWADHGSLFLKHVFKGLDPVDAKDSKRILASMNGEDGAGNVGMY